MYLEDLHAGDVFDTPARTVTAEDVRKFAEITGDFNPVHLDPEFARATPFGRPIAHGLLTVSLALGLWSTEGITRDSLLALVSLEEMKFRKPIYPGDTLRLHTEVLEVKSLRSRPDAGLVVYRDQVRDNNQEVVVEFRRTVLLKKRFTVEPTAGSP